MTFPASDPTTPGKATSNEHPSRPADRQAPIITREEVERASAGVRTGIDSAMAEAAVRQGARIQDNIDELDRKKATSKKRSGPMQAGERHYPHKFPAQHLTKPGIEADLEFAPMYQAPAYTGSGKLKDMTAIITGGDSGIGRAVAVLFAREGADIAIVNEHDDAEDTRRAVENEGRRCILIAGDIADAEFCNSVVQDTIAAFGRVDLLVNNAAFQQHAATLST